MTQSLDNSKNIPDEMLSGSLLKALYAARDFFGPAFEIVEDQARAPLTYEGLIKRISAMRCLMKSIIASDEKHIALMLPNSIEKLVAIFGVLATGRVAAILNYNAGPLAIASACKTSEIKTVFTLDKFVNTANLTPLVAAIEKAGVRVVYLERARESMCCCTRLMTALATSCLGRFFAPLPAAKEEDPAIILFTSGSEGMPKGVVLSHGNILSNVKQFRAALNLGHADRLFLCLPMYHSFGMTVGAMLPVLIGMRDFIYLTPLHYHLIPGLIKETKATLFLATDTFLNGYARNAQPDDFRSLRFIIAGAEKVKAETHRIYPEKFGVRILEGYGVTETSPVLSVNTPEHNYAGSVGRPLRDIQVKLEPVEGIQDGNKLWVKGPNIMMGYFKEDKPGVLQPPVDGWHDTGDIVSVHDGYITILGRQKRFAKIGGEMVSLMAVEQSIAKGWAGRGHIVVSVPHARKGELLVLLTEDPDLTIDMLRAHLRENGFPELAVPRRIMHMEKTPVLGSGKTDYVGAKAMAMADAEKAGD